MTQAVPYAKLVVEVEENRQDDGTLYDATARAWMEHPDGTTAVLADVSALSVMGALKGAMAAAGDVATHIYWEQTLRASAQEHEDD